MANLRRWMANRRNFLPPYNCQGEPGRREAAAAPEPGGREAIAALGPIENETYRKGPAGRTRGHTQERIQLEARKLVPGDDGQPTSNPDLINAAFPLTRPPQDEWDYNTAEAAETPEACIQETEGLLRTLGTLGYRASAKKAQICKSEGLLLNPLRVIFTPPTALNPASLLPDPDMGTPFHDCANILAQVYGVREDLQDQPLSDADAIWFTDRSSFVHQGQRYVGAAVTSETEVVWAEALPPGTSAQKAELIALTQALKLGRDRKLTVYTDSRYAFATAHVH
ncbi:uncharacterized protein LOC132665323 [Panthera onca]